MNKNKKQKNNIDQFIVNINEIIYPSDKQIESILNKWVDRHSESWDYESDRENVRKTLLEYKRKIINKNKRK